MDEPKAKNDNRIRSAGLRMALKLLPEDMLAAAPAHLERYLKGRLEKVELEPGEEGAVFMLANQADGTMKILTVTLDKRNTVLRIVEKTDINTLFKAIFENLKEL